MAGLEIKNDYQKLNAFKAEIRDIFRGTFITNSDTMAEKIWEHCTSHSIDISLVGLSSVYSAEINNIKTNKDVNEQCRAVNLFLEKMNIDPAFQAFNRDNKINLETVRMEIVKPRTVALQVNDLGEKIFINAAPELAKTFLGRNEKVPQCVVLPKKTFREHLNFAEVEFLIYTNWLFQKHQKVIIICTGEQENRLRRIIQLTLFGPDYDTLLQTEKDPKMLKEYSRLRAFREILALRDDAGKKYVLDDFIGFINFQGDRAEIPMPSGEVFKVVEDPKNPEDVFHIYKGSHLIARVDLYRANKQEIDCPVERYPVSYDELGIYVLDSGTGFSPDKHTTSFVLWLSGIPVLVDPMAYSDDYLRRKGLPHQSIRYILPSHMHADHDQGLYNYLLNGEKIVIIGPQIVVNQAIEKISATIGISMEDAAQTVRTIILPVEKRVPLPGFDNIDIEITYGFHSIPTTMFKVFYKDAAGKTVKSLGYSGDTIYDPEKYGGWIAEGKIDRETIDTLKSFFKDTDIIIHEAGGGYIHTEYPKFAKDHPDKEIYWVHTQETNAEKGTILQAGQHFSFIAEDPNKRLQRYMKLFDKTPLFGELSASEKLELSMLTSNDKGITIERYEAGETIMKEGDLPKDRSVYIISRGTIDLYKNQDGIDEYIGVSLGEGQPLGEMAQFQNNKGLRCATVKALSGVELIKVSEDIFNKFYQKLEDGYRKYATLRDAMDARNSPFKSLSQEVKDAIAVNMEREEIKPKDFIIRKERSHNRKLYLITGGCVAVIVDRNGVGYRVGKGQVLGEMSLLEDGTPPSADVLAMEDHADKSAPVILYSLSKEKFDKLKKEYPVIYYVLDGLRKDRLRQNELAAQKKCYF
jgi:CRP-like cAMP-binding protein